MYFAAIVVTLSGSIYCPYTQQYSDTESNGNVDGQSQNDESDGVSDGGENVNDDNNLPHDPSVPQQDDPQEGTIPSPRKNVRSSKIRDMLIFKEINNDRLPTILPSTVDMIFGDPSDLHIFKIKVTPSEGYWSGGTFFFDVVVPEEYNFEPPKVKCTTRIWHPNISEDGSVCLSILRSNAIDETGWNPTRQLKDVILGINSLFTDLVNFHDPLNNEVAEMFRRDPYVFRAKVNAYIQEYAKTDTP